MDSSSSSFAESNSVNSQSLSKHVLSPMVVNDIAKNAQVVWANCPKQEGLLGRSDMRLQTAVGMPVAMDASGNMCIVVMFSPRIVSNSKDAMEFIKLISQGAASSSAIPCLLPVVDNSQKGLEYNPKRFSDWQQNEIKSENDWSLDAILSRDGQHQAYKVVSTESNRLLTADSANTVSEDSMSTSHGLIQVMGMIFRLLLKCVCGCVQVKLIAFFSFYFLHNILVTNRNRGMT